MAVIDSSLSDEVQEELHPPMGIASYAANLVRNLKIGSKLSIGFGSLVALTLLVAGFNYLGSMQTVRSINQTTNLSAPSAVASARAQADLLRMLSAVRGYLALGEDTYRTDYQQASASFFGNLKVLTALLQAKDSGRDETAVSDVNIEMEEFRSKLATLQGLPDKLFDLHNDQLRREPALKILIADANPLIAKQVAIIKSMMSSQQTREASAVNTKLLSVMAEVQSSLYAMVAGLRGYVTTKRENFKFEYNANLSINTEAWNDLSRLKTGLTPGQQGLLDKMTVLRDTFLKLPNQMFEAVEGEHAREDLYLFRTELVPIAERMLAILDNVAQQKQLALQSDLGVGRDQLVAGQRAIMFGGVIAVLTGLLLSYIFREGIAGPIRRLTGVADRIRQGDLSAQAPVESADEIGELATTFNKMTHQLNATLEDVDRRRQLEESLAIRFRRQSEYLGALHDTSIGLITHLDLAELLSDLTARAGELLGTPHGYVYLVDENGTALERKVGIGVYAASIGQRLGPNEGVAGTVWVAGKVLVINDYQNWEGQASASRGLDITIKSVLGAPLKSANVTVGVLGIAYDDTSVLNFGDGEVELINRFAQLASIALENARLHEATQNARLQAVEAGQRVVEQNRTLESLSSKLSKYLSPQVFASIFSGKQGVEISSKRKKLTVFFSDIADFTATTDNLESEELTDLLNHYLTEMAKIALEHGATIDKYIGDAILAFFGDPDTRGVKEDALACVKMAVAMQRRMRDLQSEWINVGRERPFHLRIGINTGFCTVGNFGSEDRMDYTIIGGEVNLASRLQSHADLGGILLAHETYALVKDEFETDELPPLSVKGFAMPVRTYRVIGSRGERKSETAIFHHIQEGLRIEMDAAALKSTDRASAIAALERLIGTLRQ